MGYTYVESDLGQVLADFERFDTFAFDIETTGLNPLDSRILLVQVGFPEIQYVIDAKLDLTPLLPFLGSRKWKKLYFNGKFDETFMLKYYNTPINNVFDCMVAEKVIDPASKWGNSFEDLALQYLNVVLDKKVRKSFINKPPGPFTESQLQYAAEDVEYLFPMYELQEAKIKKTGVEHIAELEFDLITVVAHMEIAGVPVNGQMWAERLAEYKKEHAEVRKKTLTLFTGIEEFNQQVGIFEDAPETLDGVKTLNLGSPDQLKKAFAGLGIKVKDTKEQTIALIRHPAAEALMEYRKLDKIMTSYGDSFIDRIHPFSGRIHANWHQVGTETGRFSCSDPNLQQIPPKFRACVGGEADWDIISADFSQMELRILAQESGDPILVDAFQKGKDIHSVTASTMFNLEMDNISKEQRYAAKTLNFGITYGMKVRKFVDMMNAEAKKNGTKPITIKQGTAMLEKYKETYAVATDYLNRIGIKAIREGKTMTRFGRKRFFRPVSTALPPDAFKGQIEAIKRQGANMPIQGTNADITKMAMIQLHHDFRDYGYKAYIVLQVHDEIVVLAHKSQVEVVKPLIVEAMITAGQRLLPDIPIVVDVSASTYWQK